jgi:ribulose-bisphosphate carboxylase large chain
LALTNRITAIYRIRSDAKSIGARADALAVEQSVEMPVSAIDDRMVLDEIVGRIEGIEELERDRFEVRIGLAVATTGLEVGQLMNMLFGNSSIYPEIELHDAILPSELLTHFGGPRHGLEGMRTRVRAQGRAMTCSALKPQGFSPARLAELARRFTLGGIDYVKDDHGLADQAYSPFAERVKACAAAVAEAARETGHPTRYLPSLSGDLDRLRIQIKLARDAGLDGVLVAPMVVGLPAFHALVRENPDMAFMAHPALAGAARFAPPLLLGKLFRLFGADATVFPNHGGRFGYSPETCAALADAARGPWDGLKPCVPVPAGGMTPERVPELLDFYGTDAMLLIGGGLLAARERLVEETTNFVARVANAKPARRASAKFR